MSGMVGAGLSVLSGLLSWATGRQQAQREAQIKKSGQDEVKVVLAEDALKRTEADRKSKEHTDAVVRTTPDDDLIAKL